LQPLLETSAIRAAQVDLPIPEVVGCGVRGSCASRARCQVLEELDPRPLGRAQSGDAQVRTEHIVEMLLLGAEILAGAGDAQSEQIVVEALAGVGVRHDDGGVVDAEEQTSVVCMPSGSAFARRKGEQLQIVAVRVAEIESFDACGVWIPVG
jgi:hypothetical protein